MVVAFLVHAAQTATDGAARGIIITVGGTVRAVAAKEVCLSLTDPAVAFPENRSSDSRSNPLRFQSTYQFSLVAYPAAISVSPAMALNLLFWPSDQPFHRPTGLNVNVRLTGCQ